MYCVWAGGPSGMARAQSSEISRPRASMRRVDLVDLVLVEREVLHEGRRSRTRRRSRAPRRGRGGLQGRRGDGRHLSCVPNLGPHRTQARATSKRIRCDAVCGAGGVARRRCRRPRCRTSGRPGSGRAARQPLEGVDARVGGDAGGVAGQQAPEDARRRRAGAAPSAKATDRVPSPSASGGQTLTGRRPKKVSGSERWMITVAASARSPSASTITPRQPAAAGLGQRGGGADGDVARRRAWRAGRPRGDAAHHLGGHADAGHEQEVAAVDRAGRHRRRCAGRRRARRAARWRASRRAGAPMVRAKTFVDPPGRHHSAVCGARPGRWRPRWRCRRRRPRRPAARPPRRPPRRARRRGTGWSVATASTARSAQRAQHGASARASTREARGLKMARTSMLG